VPRRSLFLIAKEHALVPATDALLRDPGVRVSTLPLLLQPALASNGNVTLVHHSETCPLTSHLSRRIAPYYAHTRIAQERVLPCKAPYHFVLCRNFSAEGDNAHPVDVSTASDTMSPQHGLKPAQRCINTASLVAGPYSLQRSQIPRDL
jgi:hypothetical protein